MLCQKCCQYNLLKNMKNLDELGMNLDLKYILKAKHVLFISTLPFPFIKTEGDYLQGISIISKFISWKHNAS